MFEVFLLLLLLTEQRANDYFYSLRFWKFKLFYLSLIIFLSFYDGLGVGLDIFSLIYLILLLDTLLDYYFYMIKACLNKPTVDVDLLFFNRWIASKW
jgi:hypothetical protein